MLTVNIKKELSHFMLDVELQIENEIIVLFGPSGSGKTTILNCISGITHPDTGSIKLLNKVFFNETEKPMKTQKRNTGYLIQDYALFPHMTVGKNIIYGVKDKSTGIKSTHIKQMLSVLKIEHLLTKYPHQISGGEKQRVALARSLASEPDVLLLDEPLSALDEETRKDCQEELLRIHDLWKIPFIIVTHDKAEAKKLGDRILYMEKGKIVREESSAFTS